MLKISAIIFVFPKVILKKLKKGNFFTKLFVKIERVSRISRNEIFWKYFAELFADEEFSRKWKNTVHFRFYPWP